MRLSRCLLLVALLLILGCLNAVSACSCAQPGPPCSNYGEAAAIFLGRVVGSAERKSYTDEAGNKTIYDVGTIRFLVQESFKGVSGYEVEIHSGTGGGDCGYWFLRNESYLVYAYKNSKDNLYTSICTRTADVSNAKEDLEFLRGLSDAKPGGTLYGRLFRIIGDHEYGPFKEGPKPAGVKINIKGEAQTFEAVTNEAGEYRLSGLPAGDYDVFPELPANLGATAFHDMVDKFGSYSGHKPISLANRGCAEMSFTVQFNGLISGKVTDAKGEPVKDVHISLAWADDQEKEFAAWTDENGHYEFHMVQPGNYFLGFNLRWVPDKDDPYPRTYYPGVKDKSDAALLTVGEGEKLKGYDLTVPSRLTERELKVTVVWPDGRPAAAATVSYEASDDQGTSLGQNGTTDEKGTLTIRLFNNYRYVIFAYVDRSPDKDVHSKPLELLIDKTIKPLKLVLSRPDTGYADARKLTHKPAP
jgi:hypothetical protein